MADKPSCRCGDEVYAKGRCQACYRYWRRTGRERPFALIVRRGLRLEEREAVAEMVRALRRTG